MKSKIMFPVALSAAAIFLSGCGSSAGDLTSATPGAGGTAAAGSASEASRPALETAVRTYSDAYLSGQGSVAYGLLSQRCQQRFSQADITGLTQAAKAQYGVQPIQNLTVDTLAGTLARVTYTYSTAEINQQSEPWVFERSAWHQDDC
ncbi:hypothetical protein [Frankia sp. AgKG'84/4]|uniref:hypothetical protein n=1 Tax=Frankia sp. AgKG'84/4 TaxID=573490 RepID=UPI00200FA527|nr:hypothetical protein [Frankia sp. AgKG'84/4]MCL9794805.1 hypothetical protein [Frankia sp. AgKG'84/4]